MRNISVTGMGVVSAIGVSPDTFWRNLLDGVVGLKPIPVEHETDGPHFWSPVTDSFDLSSFVDDAKVVRRTERFVQYALAAALDAVRSSGAQISPTRTAVVLGTTMGSLPGLVRAQERYDKEGAGAVPARLMASVIPNMASAHIAMLLGLHGPQLTISSACASSLDAVAVAAMYLESGMADVAIAGGTENFLDLLVYHSLVHAKAVSRETDAAKASRPFDRARTGFVMGEGAGIVILERSDEARRRGARVWGSLRGYGSLADGYHVTAPDPTGRWEQAAMGGALADAGLAADDIDAVIAHGTGTPVGDAAEIHAMNAVYGGRPLPVTSIKGHIGHSMGASGVMSLIAGLYALQDGVLPPTTGTTDLDPQAEFSLVLGGPRRGRLRAIQVNAFGFGGQNASLVVADPR